MKTMLTSMLIFLGLQISVYSQNRICGWETEKITSIKVEFTDRDHQKEINTFNDLSDVEAILSFLKNVDFRVLNDSNRDSLDLNGDQEYRIIFTGQRDQVYLQAHAASIGKTSFLIDQNVTRDFSTLVHELKTN